MGRGRGKRGGGAEEREDQYGGGFGSQDREEHFSAGRGGKSGSGGGLTGGGEAGSTAKSCQTMRSANVPTPWLCCVSAGGSQKGSQVSYVRQVPKFLQAHAHLLGKGAVASMTGPEGATLVQDVDSDKEDELEHDDGVHPAHRQWDCNAYWTCPVQAAALLLTLLCYMQGALQRAVAEKPELAQQEPALLKLANKVTPISTHSWTPHCVTTYVCSNRSNDRGLGSLGAQSDCH